MSAKETDTHRPSVPLVRIFLSSPGDVAEERKQARKLIDGELMKRPHLCGRGALQVIAWDDPAAQIPMLANETPQESVNAARPRPADCDIVIVILWSRLGTPLPESICKPDGTRYLSGTEWEYEDAVNSARTPPPQVLLYRRTEEPTIGLRDPHKKEKEEQFERVDAFFARFRNPDGSLKGGVNEYTTAAEFKPLLQQHLDEILNRLLLPASRGGSGKTTTAAIIPAEYLAWLQRTCADVSLLGQDIQKGHALTLSHVYVPALTRPAAQPEMAKRGKEQARQAAEEQKLVPLLQRLDEESLYVPGPAGLGKSTFCRWAALQSIPGADLSHPLPAPDEFAEPALKALRGRLPLLVPLRDFWTSMDCGNGRQTWHRNDFEEALAGWAKALEGLSSELIKAHLKAGSAFVLLDGLDEVPPSASRDGRTVFPRELLLSGLGDALPVWLKAGNRILLTSRPYGLDEAGLHRIRLSKAPLEPLPPPLQDLFVGRWFHTLGRPEMTSGLIETIRGREDLGPLVENPMLLTALCVLYDSGGHLPEDRYELYRRIVNNVLHNRIPDDASLREPVLRRLEAIAHGMHTGDKSAPRLTPAAEISWVETEQLLARFAELNPAYEKGSVGPAIQREELLTRSGLLLPRPNERAAFNHLTFQDFLAAQRIARTADDVRQVFRERSAVPEWRSTLMFLFAAQLLIRDAQWGLELLKQLVADQDRTAVKANPWPAVFLAEALDLCLAKYEVPEALKESLRRLSLNAIEDEVALQARQLLGLSLGGLGDPRIFDLRDARAYVEVPADTYVYGDNREKFRIEAPFLLGKYPVTNSQYRAFMDDDGYAKRQYWSDAGWAWQQKEGVTEPRLWRDRRWNGPNQPVVGVSFWEADACCRWAGGRLPTERKWEAAARGPGGFVYPWGNDWEDGICNSEEAGLGVTSTVGLFPRSRQARLGLEDLAGNVWEWCDDLYKKGDVPRVLRGGSYGNSSGILRASVRFRYLPEFRFGNFGFRCVLALPRQP